jgi:hypothetical protein
MTVQELKDMPSNKIKSISISIGNFGTSMQFKIMKERDLIVVVTREGLLKYLGNAQYAFMSGVKNIHYKTFKNVESAIKFINS